ncbi:ABC transporter ATP-binding protein [uncultured Roseobacter sp.]|uniref:ABC transporter ATP-binding protein n=1 Tax=uncultured Roseobacter sp. TaxID=114847 RepID=UPI00261FE5D4|nr:ABC transporter ATP-binding protein [uncultured Roseobacter sp.]
MSEAMLQISNVDKFYGPLDLGVHAVKNVSLDVARGDIIALLGSSGCGKTSTLRMIAGFEEVSRGSISIAGREVQTLPPVKRNVAMAFEGYSLYPTVTVRDNIAFALKSSGRPAAEIAEKVAEIAEMLEITDILDRFPSSISGGQQQRASLARALIRDADLYLLDEPMGQLEPQLRTLLRGRIKYYIKERGLTAILVTHDQTEANALADKIAVMEDGEMQQYASPEEIKDAPANLFTGTFVGEPPMNVFPAQAAASDETLVFALQDGSELSFPKSAFAAALHDRILGLGKVTLGVRPYAVHRKETGAAARVLANQWLGDQSHIAAEFAGGALVLVEHDRAALAEGDQIAVQLDPDDLHIFDPQTGAAISHGASLVG